MVTSNRPPVAGTVGGVHLLPVANASAADTRPEILVVDGNAKTTIPRRIIHIYSAPEGRPDDVPLAGRAAMVNATLLHPQFEHRLFGRAEIQDFIEKEFPEFRKVFTSFVYPIQRFDFFRYLVVYRLGGFYFDLDVYLARPLDPLTTQSCVFPFEELTISDHLRHVHGMDWEMANYGFGAAPGHPLIGAIIENCVRGVYEPEWTARMLQGIPGCFRDPFVVPASTGPGMVSRTFAEHPELHPCTTVLFPADVCDETTWHRFGDFGVHLMQGSWRKRQGYIRSRLGRIWEMRKRAQLMRHSRKLGGVRRGQWHEL
jgi:inositol phosphorylceramide mannosyltransferase catalytic subunit